MSSRPIYMDHHATTPVDPRVFESMQPYFCDLFGNAASLNHWYGETARDAVDRAREQVAGLLATDPQSVIFTSGATEANNLALKGVLWSSAPGSHLIVNAAEHPAVLDPADRLARMGYAVTKLPVDEFGRVSPQSVADAIRPETALVSVMWANNEVGTINPIAEIADVCRERGVFLHCDAVQAAGRLAVDLSRVTVDLLSLSAHKLYGPKGVGALIVRRGGRRVPLTPLLDGGGHERHLRSGTLPVPLIVGFGAACVLAGEGREVEQQRQRELCERLWSALSEGLDGIHLNGHPTERLAGNLNVSFAGVRGEALMAGVTQMAVSSGSACTTADPEPSHVLRALGRGDALTRASLRFGLGRSNTEDEVDLAAAHVIEVVQRLRA